MRNIRKFDRLLIVLSLIGVLVAVHLWIQDSRGFDRGCMGFTTSEGVEEAFDCESVLDSEYSQFLGISNVYWGLLFYIAMSGIGVLILLSEAEKQKQFRLIRTFMISAGILYSIYLIYTQYFILGEFCALCLMSAVVTMLLFISQIVYLIKHRIPSLHANVAEKEFFKKAIIAVCVIAMVDFGYFKSQDILNSDETESTETTDSDENINPEDCAYNQKKDVISNYTDLFNKNDITAGDPNSDVTIIEYFDPNCKHCKKLEPVMRELIDVHPDVYFVFKMIPLWEYSYIQIQALHIAHEEGLFYEMAEEQFKIQNPKQGLSLNTLKRIANKIGMDGSNMVKRIENDDYKNDIKFERLKARKHGIKRAPTVLINGQIVSSKSRSKVCFEEFFNQIQN